MTAQLCSPFCSSEKVYGLLNTLHCKKCKNIWNVDKKNTNKFDKYGSALLINNPVWTIKRKTDILVPRMSKKMNEYIKIFNGKFTMDRITWKIGDITIELFKRYLKKCVKISL